MAFDRGSNPFIRWRLLEATHEVVFVGPLPFLSLELLYIVVARRFSCSLSSLKVA